MNRTLRRIDPWSAAKISAATAAVFMFVYVLIALLVMTFTEIQLAAPDGALDAASIWLVLLMPVAYLFVIYWMTLLICLIFNTVAGWLGGIRIELSDD
ncbi:hypothetical protein [Lentisalinibacter sediminis]|uniref:hypothetical protein n=1 Tax=Lentisalinibacter sediminis TaxID=2992237 RepID=UPI00386F5BC9